MLEAMRGKYFRNLFCTFFLLMNILLLTFSAALFGQWEKAQAQRQEQENLSQSNMIVKSMDEKFSSLVLVSTQIAAADWLKYVSAKSDIIYSRVDYQKRKEICQTIGNQNDSLRIAKSTAVLLPYRNIAIDRKSFWEMERYFHAIDLEEGMLEDLRKLLENRYGSLVLYQNEGLLMVNVHS